MNDVVPAARAAAPATAARTVAPASAARARAPRPALPSPAAAISSRHSWARALEATGETAAAIPVDPASLAPETDPAAATLVAWEFPLATAAAPDANALAAALRFAPLPAADATAGAGEAHDDSLARVSSRLGSGDEEPPRRIRPGTERATRPARAEMRLRAEEAMQRPVPETAVRAEPIPETGMEAARLEAPAVAAAEIGPGLVEAARAAPARIAIATPVASPAFADAAATRVAWLAAQGVERAEIAVTPPDLGPVEAHISIRDGEATILFVAASPEARQALEDSLPRLAERLAEGGLALAGASVSSERRPGRDAHASREDRAGVAAVAQRALDDVPAARAYRHALGLVDDFA
ncbi:MAG: flagellar hook-length control protein FliK [Betaproteobacteria bacterium]|nr:flagellar hook-length control protein FliK [Betaproteobacteria bacterium]